jgi:regulatory protein
MNMSEEDFLTKARRHALNRMNRRECSSQDIYQFLIRKGIPSEIATQVVQDFKKNQFINDERFAKMLTRQQVARSKGPNYIRQKLRDKGIQLKPDQMNDLIEEVSETTELELARQLVLRKYPRAHLDRLEANRAFQALIRRGFSYSIAREALNAQPESE